MKYIAIVLLVCTVSFSDVNGVKIYTDKLTGEESAAAEADIDALMDKYDDQEKKVKDDKEKKKTQVAQ